MHFFDPFHSFTPEQGTNHDVDNQIEGFSTEENKKSNYKPQT